MELHLHSPSVNFILDVVQERSGVVKYFQYMNSLSPPRTIPSAENKYVDTLSQVTCITNLLRSTKWMNLAVSPQFLLTEQYHLLTPGQQDSGLLNCWLQFVLPTIGIEGKRCVHTYSCMSVRMFQLKNNWADFDSILCVCNVTKLLRLAYFHSAHK